MEKKTCRSKENMILYDTLLFYLISFFLLDNEFSELVFGRSLSIFFLMIWIYLLSFIKSVSLQIDLGCESMRASMMERGSPVSIVMNSLGRRYTPAVAAILPISNDAPPLITDDDVKYFKRSVGDLSIVQRYPLNSTRFLPQLLGKNYSSSLISFFIKRSLVMPFDADDDNYLELIAYPEFFAAQLISSAINDCKMSKINRTVDELSLVVPKFLTHHQRTAFIRSAKLSTYNARLIDTFTAVGTLFAVERNQLFKKKSLYVCFIDIGASQIQVSIQEFTKTRNGTVINELGYAWNDTVGSYSIDCQIAKSIKREIQKQKQNVTFDDKAKQKILAAARRVKHELTLQPKVSLFLEDLLHGYDMTFTYSMDRLKKRCHREIKVLNDTFYKAFWNAGFDVAEDIDRIELVGGGTRSPLFIDFINKTMNFNGSIPVYRSLNTEEAAVIGAGYVIAASRKNYLSTNIKFNSIEAYNITAINSSTNRFVTFSYELNNNTQNLPIGIKPFIRTIDLGQKGRYEIINGRVKVYGCRKLTTSGLDKNKRYGVERILQAFEQTESKQKEKDKMIHEYDTYLIETREKLTKDNNVLQTSSPAERNEAIRLIANMQYQIQKNPDMEKSELDRMKSEIEISTAQIFKRANDKAEAPEAYQKLSDLLELVTSTVQEEWPKRNLRPKKKDLKRLGKLCSQAEKFLNQHEDNLDGVEVDDINLLYERLNKMFDYVQNNLKPTHHSTDL